MITRLFEFDMKVKHADSSNLLGINIAYVEYLKSIELYSSANNLAHEQLGSQDLLDNTYVKLIEEIETDSVDCDQYWLWRESANWYKGQLDYGY